MDATAWALIGVAVVAITAAAGAFVVAFRRSRPEPRPEPDATAGVSAETRQADRSRAGVRLEPIQAGTPTLVEEVPETEEEAPVPAPVASDAVEVVETQRVVEVSPEEAGVTRRQFFNRAIGTAFGSYLGLFSLASLAMLWPKLSGGFGADVVAGAINDLRTEVFNPDRTVTPVYIPEARGYIVPAPDDLGEQFSDVGVVAGGLMALYQRCVHLGCTVPWCESSQGFECPCHGSKYDMVGEYSAGPAPRNLDRFVVEERDGDLVVRTGSIVQTPRAASPIVQYPQGASCIGF